VSGSPGGWSIESILLAGVSVLAAALGGAIMLIVRMFQGKVDDLNTEHNERITKLETEQGARLLELKTEQGTRIEKLEADRSAIAVMAEQIRSLTIALEQSTERMEKHHIDNLAASKLDREETMRWRAEVMGPIIQQIATDNVLNKERIEQLQRQQNSRRKRL
jgi:hypothetical protein